MDVEDLIKTLLPFGFIIFWIISSIAGAIKQKPVQTAKPVFQPAQNRPPLEFDFTDTDNLNANSRERDQESLQKIRKMIDQRAKAEKRKQKAEKASKSKEIQKQSASTNVSHLVSDHAAEVHLEHPFSRESSNYFQKPAKLKEHPLSKLVSQLKDPGQVQNAFILSQILGEPRALQNRPKRQ